LLQHLENAPAVGVLMNECLTCGTSFLTTEMPIGWWQHSYCSQKCAEEDAKKIQEEEAAVQQLAASRPPQGTALDLCPMLPTQRLAITALILRQFRKSKLLKRMLSGVLHFLGLRAGKPLVVNDGVMAASPEADVLVDFRLPSHTRQPLRAQQSPSNFR
jgi:hypothetical protein